MKHLCLRRKTGLTTTIEHAKTIFASTLDEVENIYKTIFYPIKDCPFAIKNMQKFFSKFSFPLFVSLSDKDEKSHQIH